jgi:hypothetical protein
MRELILSKDRLEDYGGSKHHIPHLAIKSYVNSPKVK